MTLPKALPRKNQRRIFARLSGDGVYPFTKTQFRKLRLHYGHDEIVTAVDGIKTPTRIPASYRATLAAEGIAHVR